MVILDFIRMMLLFLVASFVMIVDIICGFMIFAVWVVDESIIRKILLSIMFIAIFILMIFIYMGIGWFLIPAEFR